ncbi:MAG: glycine zipper 2TM domain-containing protein, partial [Maritimibacter sp.]|nr:glycine zipper 2TM domain-containing protein [Maritimibacter sp.]
MLIAKPVFVLPLAAALMLTACTTTGPRQNTGAAAGAVAGGLLGGIVSGRPAGAAVGAVGGALVGGAIGQQLDKQAGELRAGFDDGRIGVVNTGSALVVTMP